VVVREGRPSGPEVELEEESSWDGVVRGAVCRVEADGLAAEVGERTRGGRLGSGGNSSV
jgi:hypothetical protein